MGAVWCGFVWFSYHKTTPHNVVLYGVVHYHLQCGAVQLPHFANDLGQFGCNCAV